MKCRLSDLKSKEVIETKSGVIIGRIDDVEINMEDSSVESMIVYGRPRLFGIFGREDDIVISYEDIDLIGKDTVLVSRSRVVDSKSSKSSRYSVKKEKTEDSMDDFEKIFG